MATSILDILDCPVCLTIPTATPIFQCVSNGHVVCKNCVNLLDGQCPVCRQKNGFSRCLTAEKLLTEYNRNRDVLTPHDAKHPAKTRRRCENSSQGCRAYYSYTHEISCPYRPVYCPDLTCQKRVILNKLLDVHFKEEHPDVVVKHGNAAMTFRLCVRDEHWGVTTSYKPVRFTRNGNNFYREIRRDDERRSWYFWVYFDGDQSEARNFSVEYQLLNERKEVILVHNDFVVPLDQDLQQVMLDYKGLVLPDEFLKKKIIRNDEFYLVLDVKQSARR